MFLDGPQGTANAFADEELVVIAALTAILRGKDVVILTRDVGVYEQYVRMMTMLNGDYAAMLVASSYALNPLMLPFGSVAVPEDNTHFDGPTMTNVLVPHQVIDSMRPLHYAPVHIHCLLFGGESGKEKLTPMTFCAEKYMRKLLAIKTSKMGYNTDQLGELNCTLGARPEKGLTFIAIAREKRIRLGNAWVTVSDRHGMIQYRPHTRYFFYR